MADENNTSIEEPNEPENVTPEEPKEPESTNPYQSIIDQQTEQINALIEQNAKLTSQITKMIQTGIQITDGNAQQQQTQAHSGYGFAKGNVALSDDDDFSVSSLGNLIGKRDV